MRGALLALPVVLAVALPVLAQSTDEHAVDATKSKAQFSIQHVFVDRVTGTVPIESGTVDLEPGSPIPVKVTAALDPGKMNTGDRDRDASLEGPDYFDTKAFPRWTFTSTKITATGASSFGMDGLLTIHGVTQPEHLEVVIRGDAAHPVYHATGRIDRRTWGLKGTRLDPVIGAFADVTLDVVLR